jgi:hypothetical protein
VGRVDSRARIEGEVGVGIEESKAKLQVNPKAETGIPVDEFLMRDW